MRLIKNLLYITERFFYGERGIIEELSPMPMCCRNQYNKSLDNLSNSVRKEVQIIAESVCDIPVRVKFRNPLGELIEDVCHDELAITKYDVGDNYP